MMKQCFVSFCYSVPAILSRLRCFGAVWRAGWNITLVLCFAKYGVVKDSVLATLMSRFDRAQRERDEANDRLKFLRGENEPGRTEQEHPACLI